MRLSLRPFQADAVDELAVLLQDAIASRARSGKDQALGLAAPTGSGKTIIATALIERTLFGSDGEPPIDPNGVFLWLTDQPELNEQTATKMLATSSGLGPDRLTIIPSSFDNPMLDAGRVWFLNTQKLGEAASLAQAGGDGRTYSFFETVANTIAATDRTLYVVVDEAHRGMLEGNNRDVATSIIQRFVKGWGAEMPASPFIMGISATPERYEEVIRGVDRVSRRHAISADVVRASGLIKEHILTSHAGETQTDEMALLAEAAEAWKTSTSAWDAYCAAAAEEARVVPALIVQVENEPEDGGVSRTDLDGAIRVISRKVGTLPDVAFVNAFQERVDVPLAPGRSLRYVAPSRISEDTDARIVFFKTSLNAGWDCPRAEVMFSFRKASDYTSIAQLIGRMVRSPLARRIEEDERLNAVDLFLPHYDKRAVEQIVRALTDAGDNAIGDAITDRDAIVALPRRAGSDAAAAAIEAIPNYIVPMTRKKPAVRRLADLTVALSSHGVDPGAAARELTMLAEVLLAARERLKDETSFKAAVAERGTITIRRVDWAVGSTETGDGETLTIAASDENIHSLFTAAKRVLGAEPAMGYWKARVTSDPEGAKDAARLEIVHMATLDDVRAELEAQAAARIDALFVEHGPALVALPPAKAAVYARIRGQAGEPMTAPWKLTEVAWFRPGAEDWPLHLFAREDGQASLQLNAWEAETLREQLRDPSVVAWLRNPPRKDWSFCVPYLDGTRERAMYPDLLVVREDGGRYVVDIIDPHDHTAEDSADKAKGLARYAARHGYLVGRVELVAKIGGKLRRLHLHEAATRDKVADIDSPNALKALYPTG